MFKGLSFWEPCHIDKLVLTAVSPVALTGKCSYREVLVLDICGLDRFGGSGCDE